jgi:hypothetical protein
MVVSALVIAASVAAASAQTDDRYSFSRVEEGYLRLDGRTGQVSICTRKPVGWACQLVPDERAALEAEIARLQGESAALKKELLAHDLPLPGATSPQSSVPPETPRPQLPGQVELNKLIAMMDKLWRRLVDMVWTLQREILKKT